MIAYGCCVGSQERWKQYVRPRATSPLFAVRNATNIATAYNKIITAVRKTVDVDVLVLQHDDLEIIDDNFENKVREVIDQPDVALVGVAGACGATSLAWWDFNPVGHQYTDSGLIDFGIRAGDVEVIEGSMFILSSWAINELQFDERYGAFHGYDDIGYEAIRRGKRVVVADIDTYHHTTLGWKSPEYFAEWSAADEMFKRKWNK